VIEERASELKCEVKSGPCSVVGRYERKNRRGDDLLVHIYQYLPASIPPIHCYGLWSKGERIPTAPTFHLMKGCKMWQNVVECGGVAMWQRL
jgi:hypothetical protein